MTIYYVNHVLVMHWYWTNVSFARHNIYIYINDDWFDADTYHNHDIQVNKFLNCNLHLKWRSGFFFQHTPHSHMCVYTHDYHHHLETIDMLKTILFKCLCTKCDELNTHCYTHTRKQRQTHIMCIACQPTYRDENNFNAYSHIMSNICFLYASIDNIPIAEQLLLNIQPVLLHHFNLLFILDLFFFPVFLLFV